MRLPNLKDHFEPQIITRGSDYYRKGKVKNILADGTKITAIVQGSQKYRVQLDLVNSAFQCTCPYDANCKHMVAVLCALKGNKHITHLTDITKKLQSLKKEELVATIQKICRKDPKYQILLLNRAAQIKTRINALALCEEDISGLIEEIDLLVDVIESRDDQLSLLTLLLKKCYPFFVEFPDDNALEQSLIHLIEAISRTAKVLPKTKRKAVLQNIVNLTREYDFLWDAIDDRGIHLDY